ncbi:MAG: hypothetical protein N3B01_00325 [Verrucomicrobiae bacterium]|nr:hypothetical protein [Verrucomicrobiae bacterium]
MKPPETSRIQPPAFAVVWCGIFAACTLSSLALSAAPYFAIKVVDEQTGRGVPLVELRTVHNVVFVTDSNGLIAFYEPGLMNHEVFFHVRSHGYQYPKDRFGYAGVRLRVTPGGSATIKLKRNNIAERLYRITGEGIYRDTVLLGQKPPIREPLLNGQVIGQDSVQVVPYRGKLYWFWGDTNRPQYPLGQFQTSGATSELHGTDPGVGIELSYFVDKTGFSKRMVPLKERGPVWIEGLLTVKDETGRERLIARYSRMKDIGTVLEHGLVIFNDETEQFDRLVQFDLKDQTRCPRGHAVRVGDHFYFAKPFATVRVRATLADLKTQARYEELPVPDAPKDVDTQRPVKLHNGSIRWNDYRKKWIMIAVQEGGRSSFLGEIWYSESDHVAGPWPWAKKIVTHDRYSFYNPVHHSFFDQEGGRFIYFEGTYAETFSGNPVPTPRYDYNQIMYRLDLADQRLRLPAR